MKLDTKTFYILPKPESLILEYIFVLAKMYSKCIPNTFKLFIESLKIYFDPSILKTIKDYFNENFTFA